MDFNHYFSYRFGNPLKCDTYKQCQNVGEAPQEKVCPGKSLYDSKTHKCKPQYQVDCNGRDIPVDKVDFMFWEDFNSKCPWTGEQFFEGMYIIIFFGH